VFKHIIPPCGKFLKSCKLFWVWVLIWYGLLEHLQQLLKSTCHPCFFWQNMKFHPPTAWQKRLLSLASCHRGSSRADICARGVACHLANSIPGAPLPHARRLPAFLSRSRAIWRIDPVYKVIAYSLVLYSSSTQNAAGEDPSRRCRSSLLFDAKATHPSFRYGGSILLFPISDIEVGRVVRDLT
jgi:hypothetical protein